MNQPVPGEARAKSRRRWRPTLLTAMIALGAQACGLVTDGVHDGRGTGGAGAGTRGGTTGSGGGIVLAGTGGDLISLPPDVSDAGACADSHLLADQAVTAIGAQRRFYSWTTDEQVGELRAGGPLFSRSESPGKGRGLAMTQLAAYAAGGSDAGQLLAGELASALFAKARFAWTNPWATLMGWPGETYGNQLLQIELRPEAWIAVFDENGLSVYDSQNEPVPVETALSTPEKIGAIYYRSNNAAGSAHCGTFSQGSVGFREFVLGNLQMVARWSLATPEIAQRLDDDIAALQAFEAALACLTVSDQASWSSQLSCAWGDRYQQSANALENYDFALGLPSELYWPSKDNVAAIIAALGVSMPTGDPLIVTPGG